MPAVLTVTTNVARRNKSDTHGHKLRRACDSEVVADTPSLADM